MRARRAVALGALVLLSACGSLNEKGPGLNALDTKSFWCSGCGDDESASSNSSTVDSDSGHGGDSGGQ